MKTTTILSIFTIGSLFLLPFHINAQDRNAMSRAEISKMDSVESATSKAEQVQKSKDEGRMKEVKLDRKQTRAKQKDAKRVEREASSAARESKAQVRTERKAQKSRKEATKQAKRATDAREKSDKN
jgi:hypothetical protein